MLLSERVGVAAVATVMSIGVMVTSLRHDMVAQVDSLTQEQQAALRTGGLHAAAKVSPGRAFIGTAQYTSEGIIPNVQALVDFSSLIIVGEMDTNLCRLSSTGREITTDYEVVVLESLKGVVPVGSVVIFSVPGGRVEFADGSSAELHPADYRLPEQGERYVLFLLERPNIPEETLKAVGSLGVFTAVSGTQGMFFITPELRVQPRGRRIDLVARKYRNAELSSLLAHVKAAVLKAGEVRQ